MSNYKRADRVAGEIHRLLADILNRGMRDPRIKPISITGVSVTDDLRIARVRWIPLGGTGSAEKILEGLRSAAGFLSRQMAKQLRMKYSPRLEFFIDETLEQAIQVVQSLDKIPSADDVEGDS